MVVSERDTEVRRTVVPMRVVLAVFGVAAFVVISVAASMPSRPTAVSSVAAAAPVGLPRATADPNDTSRVDPETQYGSLPVEDRVDRRRIVVRGLEVPIAGALLPTDPELLPNAARDYRAGWHEGIDFPADEGTEVRAIAAGTIVRIDHDFADWNKQLRDIALYQALQLGYTPSETLDRIRGRQVWIDHGHGIVSRYAHLSTVADLAVGDVVSAGQVIGAVGSSGYPEGGPHLHLEVRVRDSYLGDGLTGDALLAAILAAFD
jgi:murein DD-endopeptidase MepM/ murein hydrolase activator NlpD